MSKTFYSIFVFLFLASGIFFFHSCIKDQGVAPVSKKVYSFNLTEGFEGSSSNLPSGWTIINSDNDAAWQVVTTVAHTGNNCVGFNNCSGDGTIDMTGKKDWLITAAYDFTQATSVSFSFDVAYAVLNFKNATYYDSLAVYSSIDGGSTWNQVYIKGGTLLANIPAITVGQPCWTPTSANDWRTDKINLNNLAGHSNVKFAFENISDWGEWIYIDNVTIAASNGGNGCDSITYAKSIQPIMMAHCATSGCHRPGGSGPIDYTTYAGAKLDADNGNLKKRMMDGNPSMMPLTGKLPDAILSKVQCWLDSGAPNN